MLKCVLWGLQMKCLWNPVLLWSTFWMMDYLAFSWLLHYPRTTLNFSSSGRLIGILKDWLDSRKCKYRSIFLSQKNKVRFHIINQKATIWGMMVAMTNVSHFVGDILNADKKFEPCLITSRPQCCRKIDECSFLEISCYNSCRKSGWYIQ